MAIYTRLAPHLSKRMPVPTVTAPKSQSSVYGVQTQRATLNGNQTCSNPMLKGVIDLHAPVVSMTTFLLLPKEGWILL